MNEDMQRGLDSEQQALFEYQVETGLWVDEVGLVLHPTHDWLAATPDGAVGNDGLVEVKCPRAFRAAPPEYHYAQIQGQLEITGRDWCKYVQLVGESLTDIHIQRDREWWARALPVLEKFWGYVQTMEQPPRGSCRMP